MARLTLVLGGAPQDFALAGTLVVVGSDASCGLRIPGADVSPVHCELRHGPEGWRVVDMESRAGTKVNGEYVNTRALRDGDAIDVGGVVATFRGDAPGAAPAGAPRGAARGAPGAAGAVQDLPVARRVPSAPATQRPAPPRPAAAAARSEPRTPEEAEAAAARRERRSARRADTASSGMYVVAGVIGAVLVGWLLFGVVFKDSHNGRLRGQIAAAERSHQWQRMIELAGDAVDDGSYEYQQIRIAEDRARQNVANEATGERVEQSIKDWSTIRYWRQEHFKDNDEYVVQIDEYLRKYAGLTSVGIEQARAERVKVTGTSAAVGEDVTGAAGWNVALADAKAMENEGRFGDAIGRIDAYWREQGAAAPTMLPRVDAEKARLTAAADKWFARQVALAAHYLDNGEKRKAQKTIETAAQKIGLPGFGERASKEIERLFGGR